MREALVRLQNDGLVEVVPRHGMRVLPVSPPGHARDLRGVDRPRMHGRRDRRAPKASDAELQTPDPGDRGHGRGPGADDLEAWAAADERFHVSLVELSGNRALANTVWNYWDRAHRARMLSLRLRPKPVNSTHEHMQMVERLRAGDVASAAAVTRAHRERANQELVAIFERFKLKQM